MKQIPYVNQITKNTKGLSLPEFAYKPPDFTDAEVIEGIRYLPYDVMANEYGIYLEDCIPDESQFVHAIAKNYQYLADWLEYYLFKDASKLQLLNSTERRHYKPIADQSIGMLRLIQEVCAFAPWVHAQNICVNRWWLACEWELCVQMLKKHGYTDSPSLIGVDKLYKEALDLDKSWDEPNIKTIEVEIFQTTPMQALEGLAWKISEHPINISFRTHFGNYRKILRSSARALRNSPLKQVYIIDGRCELMLRGKPGQKRIKK